MRNPKTIKYADLLSDLNPVSSIQLAESDFISPPWDIVDFSRQFYNGLRLITPITTWHFDRSGNSALFLTEAQLQWIRMIARWTYETNPIAQGAISTLADYTLSTGFEPYVQYKKRYKGTKSTQLIETAQNLLDDVLNQNDWYKRERDAFIRTLRDGDTFIRFWAQPDGITKLRFIEPDQVRNPYVTGPSDSFGILTDPFDFEDIKGYLVYYDAEETRKETVPAHEMVSWINHFEFSAFTKRGISDYWVMGALFDDVMKLIRNGCVGEAARQGIAYLTYYDYSLKESVEELTREETNFYQPNISTPAPLGDVNQEPIQRVHQDSPGSEIRLPSTQKMQPPPIGNATNLETAVAVTLRQACVKWRMQESLLTGKVDSNYASSLVAESPMVKAREVDQRLFFNRFRCVWNKILEIGVDQEILPPDTLQVLEVCAEPIPIAVRNLKEECEINSILHANGILSARTWATRTKLDFEEEQQNITQDRDLERKELHTQILGHSSNTTESNQEDNAAQRQYSKDAKRPE